MLTQDTTVNTKQHGRLRPGNGNDRSKSFAELLQEYEPVPLRRGQFVTGEVIQIDNNVILADVDAKRTAVVPPQDLAEIEADDLANLSVGDEATFYVLRTPRGDEDLLVSLHKGLERQDWLKAEKLLDNEEALSLEVVGYNKGGLVVDFGHLRGFVPASHVPRLQKAASRKDLHQQKTELVGEEMRLHVIEVNRQRRRLILSAKQAQRETRQKRLRELKQQEGHAVSGRVTNLVSFGAFVDLDGIEGLIHVSEIAWEKVENPAAFLSKGEDVEVLILSVEPERERISLSRKALLPSPWESFTQEHAAGDLIEGVVTGVTDFGAFVGVTDEIEGLVHVSEMHGTQDFAPQDLLRPGDVLLVRIIRIQPEQQRLSLSQRRVTQSEEIDWIQSRQTDENSLTEEEE